MSRLTAVLLVGLGVSCAGPEFNIGMPSPSASPHSPAEAIDCPNIDLRSPLGERIDLTGTWETEREGTRSGIYFLRQVGECVWFAGSFPMPPETDSSGPLGYVTVVFQGRVGSDFVVTGRWIDVRNEGIGAPQSGGSITLQIEVGEEPGDIRLVYMGGSGQPFVEPGYREEQSWVKVSDGGAYPPASAAP